MAGSSVALLLFGLAAVSALPQPEQRNEINWPDRPSFWPDSLPWPPSSADNWPERPAWWPLPQWPPRIPGEWPDQPSWWPASLPWPPAIPDGWPDQPSWWPDSQPWPPARPEDWPDRPSFWPESLPWPPARPEGWPDQPDWWPDSLPWPPARPEGWPDQPSWWPENLPWPPALPDISWPPSIPEEAPGWWPDSLPWPPALPDLDSIWPPPGVNPDNIPYIPSRDNQFHLFTRANPSWSQPLLIHNNDILRNSNYDSSKRTVVLIHDSRSSATDAGNAILVPAFLAAADVNIIAVDWSAGAWGSNALNAVYSALSGNFVARFVQFLVAATGGDLGDFHLVGYGLGGLNAGFVGLRLGRQVGYVTALDPSAGPSVASYLPALSPNVAQYTEVIHTDAGQNGYSQQLGHVDFYPNGGQYQPGCGGDSSCNRNRAVYFFAESIQSGGFTGVQCDSWRDALQGNCHGPGSLNLGGLEPKTGSRGVFYLRTNALPPFSQG